MCIEQPAERLSLTFHNYFYTLTFLPGRVMGPQFVVSDNAHRLNTLKHAPFSRPSYSETHAAQLCTPARTPGTCEPRGPEAKHTHEAAARAPSSPTIYNPRSHPLNHTYASYANVFTTPLMTVAGDVYGPRCRRHYSNAVLKKSAAAATYVPVIRNGWRSQTPDFAIAM